MQHKKLTEIIPCLNNFRSHIRKPEQDLPYREWSEEDCECSVALILSGKIYDQASEATGIPRAILCTR